MLRAQDIADTIRLRLEAGGVSPSSPVPSSNKPLAAHAAASRLKPIKGRKFLTEHVIKQALTPGAQRITIPKDAIISPLAADWLTLKGIEIVRSGS